VNNRELYDINADPFEQHNVIINHPEVVAKMRKAYDTWWTETLPLMVNEKTPNSPTRPFDLLYENQLREMGIPLWNKPGL
jgi:arylsulfatase